MGLFKKILSNKNQDTKKPDIDALLSSPDTSNAVKEIDNFICRLCSWGESLDLLTEPQKSFYFNQNLEREINNGGFNQYFYNSGGSFAHETINSLHAIGAHNTAAILIQAIRQFPGNKVPKDRKSRIETVEQIESVANEFWEELDQKFFEYRDDLTSLNLDFVKKHKNLF